MSKISIVILLFIGLINIGCQSQKKQKVEQINTNNVMIDLLKLDFKNDLSKIIKNFETTIVESEFSEYLNAYKIKKIDNFKINKYTFFSKYKIDNTEVPNDSYISIVTNDENKEIITIHIKINYLDNEKSIYSSLEKTFGKPILLSAEHSINALKEKKNYIWENYQNGFSIILSKYTEGEVVIIDENKTIKVNSISIYILDNNSIIDYPNGQKENIKERLVNRFSR